MQLRTMLVKFVVRRTNLPSLFVGLTKELFLVSISVIYHFGFFPTLTAISASRHNHIIAGTTISHVQTEIVNVPSVISGPLNALIRPH